MALVRTHGPPVRVVAIAAMAENRVIGRGDALPWSLPDDMKWFRECTRGKTLLMGRKTFASIGRPLPNRRTIVLSRAPAPVAGVTVIGGLDALPGAVADAHELWVCGGAEIYALTLPWWDELLLTRVRCTIEDGDAFFPPFEDVFELEEVVRETPQLRIERHVPIEAA
jgi:dihydrofolate reductase